MRGRVALVVVGATLACVAFACADLVGITTLPDGSTYDAPPYDGPPPSSICKGSTQILITNDTLSNLGVAGGKIFAQDSTTGIISCPTSAKCSNPPPLFPINVSNQLEAYALGTQLTYTLQGPATFDAGSLHSVGFDGTGDKALLQNLAYPYWLSVSGTKTFWVDDISSTSTTKVAPATLHCFGCGSGDTPWITNLRATSAVFADSNDVYVLEDDGTSSFTFGIVACSINTACGASPRTVVLGSLDTSASTFVSDGSKVFVARHDSSDLISVDQSGAPTTLAKNVYVTALAIDAAKGELAFATDGGIVAIVKTDGSASPSVISNCDTTNYGTVDALAFDAANVYVLMNGFGTGAGVFVIPRP